MRFWVGTMLLLYTVKGVSVFGLFEVGWTVPLRTKLLGRPRLESPPVHHPGVAGSLTSAAGVMRLRG
jgi:hypothetical protein